MSRVGDYDGDENFPNEWAFWERRTRAVLSGKPMRKALAELREALLALPERRLISSALCTVGKAGDGTETDWGAEERRGLIAREGEGVCAVGAFAWHKKVKAGVDPQEAFAALPLNPDYDDDPGETAETGKKAGLSYTLSWLLMYRNDDTYADLTPEQRYDAYLAWIDEQLTVAS
jgi:hypothetical protein